MNRKTQTTTTVTNYDIVTNTPTVSTLTTGYQYDKNSNLVSITDALGRVTKNEYDELNRRIATTNAFGTSDASQTKYTYDGVGNLTAVTDANNHTTTYGYDAVNRQNKTTDALGKVANQKIYDTIGRVISNTNLYGETTTATYNDVSHITTTTNSLGTSTQTTDAFGNVVLTTDAVGRTNTYLYDKLNRRIKSTDYRSGVVIDTYDDFNNLISEKDASNNTTIYQYDQLNCLKNTSDSLGQISRVEYDNVGNKVKEYLTVDTGVERETDYQYDELNRQYSMTTAVGTPTAATTWTSYGKVGNVIGTKDALGRITTSTYDNLNRQTDITQAFGTVEETTSSYKYDKVGNRLSETNGRGYTTEYQYDKLNRQIESRDPYQISDPVNDPPTKTQYFDTPAAVATALGELALTSPNVGKVVKTTDALLHTTYVLYDKFERQIATYDATKHRTSASLYDAVDRVVSATDTFGQTTNYTYQDALRAKITVDALGLTTTETTDTAGNLTEVVDSIHPATRYEYDKRNRQTKIIDANGGTTVYTFYADGQTASVTDAAPTPNKTEYFYDIAGRLKEEKSPLGSRFYQYDLVNNRTQSTDRNGRKTNYAYDHLNRVKSETWVGNGQTFTYTYDKNSNLTSAYDGNIRYEYSYDYTDLLERVDRIGGTNPTVSFKYEYDEIGNLIKADELIANVLKATTSYEYADPRYLNTKITQTGVGLASKSVKFTYDATGLNRKVERYVDGLLKVTTTNAFDAFGRLTGIEQRNGSGAMIANDTYVLDDLNRLEAQTKDGQARSIVYDNTDQVKTVTGSNSEGYTYDKNGNRTNGGYVTDTGNRLMSDGVYNYEYDPEGNRKSRTLIADNTVELYTWDYRNRLTAIVSQTSMTGTVTRTVSYEYDVDDQRVKKTVDGVVENYYIDRNQIAFVTDGNGNQTFHYLYGLNIDQVLAQDSTTGMVWALADRLGSIETITDGEGVVVDQRTYDSFGRVLSETNPSVSFRYGYTGRERDLESGLDYYRARYYDPNVGRFISVDPMGFGAGDTNLYRYVGNNSTNATDPTGLFSVDDLGNYAYGGLENTDKFVAGFAHLVTGGYTTQLRNDVYGDRVAGQHEGLLFNAGQVAGFGVSVALGFATPTALTGVGAAARIAQGYELAQAGIGAFDTTTKIIDGKMDWRNPLSYLEVAGSFAPLIGFAAQRVLKGLNPTQCFVAGTEIQTSDGTKNIEDIQVGDWVLSDDPNTVGEIEYKQVLNTFVKETTNLVDIYIDGEKITTTEEHPFWVPDVGWVAAKDLHAGSLLQTKYESWLDVDKVEKHGDTATVYNFEVEGFHTYFVSDLGLLVHNTCGFEFRAALAENSPSRVKLDEMGLTEYFMDIERAATPGDFSRVQGTLNDAKGKNSKQALDYVDYIFKKYNKDKEAFAGITLEFKERARILNDGGSIKIGNDVGADIVSPSLRQAIQAKHVSGEGFADNLKLAARQLAGNKGEIVPNGYKPVILMELGVDSSHYSSSRAELEKLIKDNLQYMNKGKSPIGPYPLYRNSVEEVRIIAGKNNYMFIRGIDF